MTNPTPHSKRPRHCKCGREIAYNRRVCDACRKRRVSRSSQRVARFHFSGGCASPAPGQWETDIPYRPEPADATVEFIIYLEHGDKLSAALAQYEPILCPDLPRLGRVTGPALAPASEVVAAWQSQTREAYDALDLMFGARVQT